MNSKSKIATSADLKLTLWNPRESSILKNIVLKSGQLMRAFLYDISETSGKQVICLSISF